LDIVIDFIDNKRIFNIIFLVVGAVFPRLEEKLVDILENKEVIKEVEVEVLDNEVLFAILQAGIAALSAISVFAKFIIVVLFPEF
jgi:hypothetical protein